MSVSSWWSNLLGKEAGREVVSSAGLSPDEQALRAHEVEREKAERAEIEAERAAIRQREVERAAARKGVAESLVIARQEASAATIAAEDAAQLLAHKRAECETLRDANLGRESDPIVRGTKARAGAEGQKGGCGGQGLGVRRGRLGCEGRGPGGRAASISRGKAPARWHERG